MSFDAWGEGDDQQFKRNMSGFDTEDGALESFKTSLEESLNAGPTAALYRYGGAMLAQENMTGAEANEMYNLKGSEIAYKDDEMVSDFEARVAADRHFEKMVNNNTLANASEKSFANSVAGFAGSLAGGFVDPVNIATGAGLAAVMKGATATTSLARAFKITSAKNPMMESVVRNGIENLVASAVVDLVAVPLGESVTRENTSNYQRMMNVIGGTIMGASIGVALDSKMIRASRTAIREKSQVHGSQTAEVVQESLDHVTKNVANGKRPNEQFIEKKYDILNNTDRPEQVPYKKQDITSENLNNGEYFIGRTAGKNDPDQVTFAGDTGYVITDNANLASNRVTPIDGSAKGEMFRVSLKKDAKIVTDDVMDEQFAREVVSNLESVLEKHGFEGSVRDLIDVAEGSTIEDIIQQVDNVIEDFSKVPNADDLMNMALSDAGFDGYTTTARSNVGSDSNAIVLFKKSDGSISGLDTLSDAIPTKEFDPNHPKATSLADKMEQHYREEAERLSSPESSMDFEKEAFDAAEQAPDLAEATVDEEFKVFAESNGLEEDALDLVGFNDKDKAQFKAAQSVENFRSAGKALKKCIFETLGLG